MSKLSKVVSMSRRKWQAESDARTLADAQAIWENKGRAGRAISAAKRLALEAQENLSRAAKAVTRRGK